MPRRDDIKSILVIGAGPIVIGQACEFDYSGTQACKALKEEGYRIILINSNPATIMTDPDTADATYIEPITPEFIERIIIKEKPDAILPTVGGQTALNAALKCNELGILEKHNIELLGANIDAINKAEDRNLFNKAMANIGLNVPRNVIVKSLQEALEALDHIGLPAIIRPSFTLGGSGGGVATTKEEYVEIVSSGIAISPIGQVQIDQSLLGWKEYEMEVVRDYKNNAIIVCSIENIDPMGVHTGDSITVAPALTLTDKEYQIMRDASIAVLNEIGVATGGSNVQFSVNPANGELVVIEMNPRVSRSSALASKATGFPIAKVAAKLAVGYSLDEISNDITKVTPASFEPTIDYVVTKIPRFTFEKFNFAKSELSSAMKSVGEAMAIGRNFSESLQKALCSMDTGLTGLSELEIPGYEEAETEEMKDKVIEKALKILAPNRLLLVAQSLRYGFSVARVCDITKYDKWFVEQIANLVAKEEEIKIANLDDKSLLLEYKKLGFSDQRIAELKNLKISDVRKLRYKNDVLPVYKKIDTCAAEFKSFTPYIYSSYEGDAYSSQRFCEAGISNKNKVIILGGGPNRIGQGIEFDYACVHAAFSLQEIDVETIMVNCNPETVSTDYDTSDRLYFEPLTAEHVISIAKKEQEQGRLLGVVVQYGGQTPLKLAHALEQANIPILGTSPDKIDLAEDRKRFKDLLDQLQLQQPKNVVCYKVADIEAAIEKVGYPVVIRPSNVLGGRAMEILYTESHLKKYLKRFKKFLLDGAILIDRFLEDAVEFDVDVIADGDEVFVAGVMEHIEPAGIHSGDSACSLPPYSVGAGMLEVIKEATVKLAKALEVRGLMNVQYAVQGDQLFVIEVNPRASRTVPFVAKATGMQIAKIATKIMAGMKLKDFDLTQQENGFAVKEAIFPFERFDNSDILLGPEMKSTGEVMSRSNNFNIAFAKAQIAVYGKLPQGGKAFISVKDDDKQAIIGMVSKLQKNNFEIFATSGTKKFLEENGLPNIVKVNKVKDGSPHIVDQISSGEIDLVINTTFGEQAILDSYSIRRATLLNKVVYFTTLRGAEVFIDSLEFLESEELQQVSALQEA